MGLKPTEEQLDILKTDTDVLVIEAGAGASKTTTLCMYAESRPKERMIYIAYNAAIRDEAKKKFPPNVKVMTSHGIAYSRIGREYAHKLQGNITPSVYRRELRVLELIGGKGQPALIINLVAESLANFLSDCSKVPGGQHVKINRKIPGFESISPGAVINAVRITWNRMIDMNDMAVPMTHDGYLKLFMLSGQTIGNYQRVLFDESQDANPVTLDIINRSPGKKVFVGDRHQSIYKFRGAVDAMKNIPASQRKKLTGSFRFGKNIAQAANRILMVKGSAQLVRGISGSDDQVILPQTPKEREEAVGNAMSQLEQILMLSRTGASVLDNAVSAASKNKRLHFIGGLQNYRMSNLMDVYNLRYGGEINDPLIAAFETFEELKEFAETDVEIARRIEMVEKYGTNLPLILNDITRLNTNNVSEADVVLSTVHRAKGLEFDTVVLSEDLYAMDLGYHYENDTSRNPMSLSKAVEVGIAARKPLRDEEDVNICYVAMTRAKHKLILPSIAYELYTNSKLTMNLMSRMAVDNMVGQNDYEHADQNASKRNVEVNEGKGRVATEGLHIASSPGVISREEQRKMRKNRQL